MASLLITGGAGFIGSHTLLVLLDAGRVAASGAPGDVLDDGRLETVYRIRAIRGERDGRSFFLPWERL